MGFQQPIIDDSPMKIVAEGCCNHLGKIEVAKEMTKVAKLCGANYIKWQKRNPVESVPKDWHNRPHPCPVNSFGETYLDHRIALEFTIDQHKLLKEISDEIGIGYACSVWDKTSLLEISQINPSFIKIPSAANLNFDLIQESLEVFDGDIHISLGMTSRSDRKRILSFIQNNNKRFVVYHTTTEYPCPFEHLFLQEISLLKEQHDRVGYSGHNYGIAADIAAMTLGASWCERHFTLDRTAKGTDHAASLEPDGLRRLCRDVKSVSKALRYKGNDMTEIERVQSKKLRIKT